MSWFRKDEESKSTVLVTGCGFKPVGHTYQYKNRPSHNPIEIDDVEHKMNIGTAAAYRLAKGGGGGHYGFSNRRKPRENQSWINKARLQAGTHFLYFS